MEPTEFETLRREAEVRVRGDLEGIAPAGGLA